MRLPSSVPTVLSSSMKAEMPMTLSLEWMESVTKEENSLSREPESANPAEPEVLRPTMSVTNAKRRDTGLTSVATKEEDVDAVVVLLDLPVQATLEGSPRRRAAEEEDLTPAPAGRLHPIPDQRRLPGEEEGPQVPSRVPVLRRESALIQEAPRDQSQV